MHTTLKILNIEDSQADFLLIERHLRKQGFDVTCRRVDDMQGVREALDSGEWDLVLSDYSIPKINFMESFSYISSHFPDIPVILVSGSLGEEQAVELLKRGIWDFVLKDNLTRLVTAMERSLKKSEDTKAKRAAEDALKESEYRFRSIFNNSPIAIGIGRKSDGGLTEVNAAWLELYGYTRDEVLGKTTHELGLYVNPEERTNIINIIHEKGHVLNYEVRLRRKNGEIIDCMYAAELIELAGETYLQAMIIDITAQKQNKLALRESENTRRKLHAAVEQSPSVIVITDLRGNIEYANPSFTQMTGYPVEDVIDRNPRILKGGTSPGVHHELWTTITRGAVWEGDFHNRKKDGTLYWEHAIIAPVKNEQGIITNYLAIKEDITERRELEEQLIQSQKMEAIGQLAGGVAHDFNNVMQVISGNAYLQSRIDQNHGLDIHYLEEINKAVERGSSLTRSLLVFSHKQPIEVTRFDLNELMNESYKLARRLVTEEIQLVLVTAADKMPVVGDAGLVQQMLFNLTTNARDAITQAGTITVTTELVTIDELVGAAANISLPPGHYALLSVRDTGCGISTSLREKIFEPFFTTKVSGKGTGLGLPMIRSTVSRMGGEITVDSEPEQGTIFSIYLPLNETAHPPVDQGPAPLQTHLQGKGELILVTEDEDDVRRALGNILTLHNFQILPAATPAEAIAMARQYGDQIRLALMDAILPGKSGIEVLKELRTICPNVPCLFLSGYSEDILESKGIFEHHLRKPVQPVQLLAQIHQLLNESTGRYV